MKNVVDHYSSLINVLSQLRTGEKFQEFVDQAKQRMKGEDSEEYEYDLKSTRVSFLAHDETRENEFIFTTEKQKFKVEVYFAALNKLHNELQSRRSSYVGIFKKFSFLLNIDNENDSINNKDIITEGAKNLQEGILRRNIL